MCGRFTLRTPASVLIEQFYLDVRADRQLALFEPRYNIAPTQDIVVVRATADGGRPTASFMRWGLVPSWAKEINSGAPMINARGETLAEKPAFRNAFKSRRCLIPADGFYEWQQSASGSKGKKQPFYIQSADGRPFAFAGLWERWKDPVADLTIESCTIVTTAANSALSELHDRMPVILAAADYSAWLDPSVTDPAQLQYMLAPCGNDELDMKPVSTHVNKVAHDDARCIEAERTLFT